MQIINTKQGSAEWHLARLGMITGTRFSQVVSQRYNSLYANLVHERLNGEKKKPPFNSTDMDMGTMLETEARLAYSKKTGNKVERVGFCMRDDWIGCSPDGVVWLMCLIHGVIEIKCPTLKYHKIWATGKIKGLYYWQCMGNMWVTGAEWCDFVSYCPAQPLYIQRICRNEDEIDKLRAASGRLIERVKDKLKGQKMPNIDDLSDSKFLAKKDVTPEVRVTVKGWDQQDVSLESEPAKIKYVLTFEELDKPLVMNKTNGQRVAKITGSGEFDDWIGAKFVLFNDEFVEYAGQLVGGIRVKPAPDQPPI